MQLLVVHARRNGGVQRHHRQRRQRRTVWGFSEEGGSDEPKRRANARGHRLVLLDESRHGAGMVAPSGRVVESPGRRVVKSLPWNAGVSPAGPAASRRRSRALRRDGAPPTCQEHVPGQAEACPTCARAHRASKTQDRLGHRRTVWLRNLRVARTCHPDRREGSGWAVASAPTGQEHAPGQAEACPTCAGAHRVAKTQVWSYMPVHDAAERTTLGRRRDAAEASAAARGVWSARASVLACHPDRREGSGWAVASAPTCQEPAFAWTG